MDSGPRSRVAERKQRFTAVERAAMRERARELKKAKSRAEAEADLLASIAALPEADRVLVKKALG
jgi:hypothetical protein